MLYSMTKQPLPLLVSKELYQDSLKMKVVSNMHVLPCIIIEMMR